MNYRKTIDLRPWAEKVEQIQWASNIGGVLFFAKELSSALYGAEDYEGSDWVANHPLMIATLDKLSSLSGIQNLSATDGFDKITKAHQWVMDFVKEDRPHGTV